MTTRPPRRVEHRYADPLDRVWIGCAERVGLRITRDPEAFATFDGRGTLALATPEALDADDSLAQMIFHELCHSMVEGPESFEKRDWGLDNMTGQDDVRERACLRVQAFLVRPLGLERFLAPTTDFRADWDALGPDPFEPAGDPSVPIARRAAARSAGAPWAPHVREALEATAEIVRQAARFERDAVSLFAQVPPQRARHRTGFWAAAPGTRAAAEQCARCAWARARGTGLRCVAAGRATGADEPACERWEPPLDCRACAACCREGFDTLLLGPREPVVRRHPELVVVRADGSREIPRPTGVCPALEVRSGVYACRIYDDRPRSCRELPVGGSSCLLARRRVGATV